MSADNGIYIAKFPDGYRITCAQAIENVDYFPEGSKKRKKELKSYFGESEIYKTEQDAFNAALELSAKMEEDEEENGMGFFVLEYGICYIGEYELFL